MAAIVVQTVGLTDQIEPTYSVADAGGDTFVNNGRTFLHIINGGGSAITATVESVVKCNQGFEHDVAISVGAGQSKMCGPFNVSRFKNADGVVDITYSDVTSVTIAAIALSN